MSLPSVAFVCVHNSCRSQIAEALGKLFASDTFVSYSAGTQAAPQINPIAVRLMKERYKVDIAAYQHPKLLAELPPVDMVITMGCNVSCPNLPCKQQEDWGIDDPTDKSEQEFIAVIEKIHQNMMDLRGRLKP